MTRKPGDRPERVALAWLMGLVRREIIFVGATIAAWIAPSTPGRRNASVGQAARPGFGDPSHYVGVKGIEPTEKIPCSKLKGRFWLSPVSAYGTDLRL